MTRDPTVRLSTLGRLELRTEEDGSVESVLSQPKRAGLLAYLALANPRGRRRREVVAATFWPESDRSHALSALRKAVYFLRDALGEEVITGHRDPVLGVDRARLWCDVRAFRRALDENREEDALALYRGDLLKGFFLDDARSFEEWVHRERGQLRRKATRAAVALSERREESGALDDAVRWARRALDLTPWDEAILRQLIQLLDASGRRTDAMRLYRAFSSRVEDKLNIQPDRETRKLMASVLEE